MRHVSTLTVLPALTVVLTAAFSAVAADNASVDVRLGPMSMRPVPDSALQAVNQEAILNTGTIRYGIRYTARWEEGEGTEAQLHEGYLGMPFPHSANWYHGGFMRLDINGHSVGETRLQRFWVAEEGSRGVVRLLWDTPQATVLKSFAVLPGDDRLLAEIRIQPKVTIESLVLKLSAYPSFFTYHHRRDGNRQITTSHNTYEQGEVVEFDPAEASWMALYDTVFDPATSVDAMGGCAFAVDPSAFTAGTVSVGSYSVPIELTCAPDSTVLRLAFWDFDKKPNEQSLQRFYEKAPQTVRLLPEFSFFPSDLADFDTQKAISTAIAEARPVPGSGAMIAELEAKAEALGALLARLADASDLQTLYDDETAAREQIAELELLIWDLRFFTLIHG